MFKRLAIAVVAIVFILVFALLFAFVFQRYSISRKPSEIQNTSTLLKQVQTISELATVKYIFEKLVILEDVKWYGENRVMLVAHGVVKAGIDFQKLGTNDLQIESYTVLMVKPGYIGPFVATAKVVNPAGPRYGVEATLIDEGNKGRIIATASAAFRKAER